MDQNRIPNDLELSSIFIRTSIAEAIVHYNGYTQEGGRDITTSLFNATANMHKPHAHMKATRH